MAKGLLLSELAPGMEVAGVYLLWFKDLGVTKNGKAFGKLSLADQGGRIEARLWDNAEELLTPLKAGQAVAVRGRVDSFRGQTQVILNDIQAAPDDPAGFLPASPIPVEDLWERLGSVLHQVHDRNLKRLLETFFADQEFRTVFGNAPAAKAAHHAYVAGLLEHTSSLGVMASHAAAHYTHLDADLLITGALLHDIGKTQELTLGPPIDYTTAGRLMGHLVLGLNMLDERLAGLPGFPVSLADQVRHLIASHHGIEEFGSPVRPKTPEAMVLHLLDDLDAKTAMISEALAARPEDEDWTNYHRLLERHLYTPGGGDADQSSTPPPVDQPSAPPIADPATPPQSAAATNDPDGDATPAAADQPPAAKPPSLFAE